MFDKGFKIGSNGLSILLNATKALFFFVLAAVVGVIGLVAGLLYNVIKIMAVHFNGIAMTFLLALVLWPAWNYGVVQALYGVSPISYIEAYLLILVINIFTLGLRPTGEKLSATEKMLLDVIRKPIDASSQDTCVRRHGSGPPTQAEQKDINPKPGPTGGPQRPVSQSSRL